MADKENFANRLDPINAKKIADLYKDIRANRIKRGWSNPPEDSRFTEENLKDNGLNASAFNDLKSLINYNNQSVRYLNNFPS